MMRRPRVLSFAVAPVAFAAILLTAPPVRADDTIKRPGDHPMYAVELEPHGVFGWGGPYGTDGGLGVGGRVSITVVQNGFIPTINNSIAVSFGLDWVHYSGCYGAFNCSADYVEFPVTMQWNFFVSQRWSVFGEPGIYIFHGWLSSCFYYNDTHVSCPAAPVETSVYPAFYVGARYHFSDKAALTMRVGFPAVSVGVSFFP